MANIFNLSRSPHREEVSNFYRKALEEGSSSTLVEDIISQFETKDPKSGWNKEKQRWYPYKSLEGGRPTIGYGEKMSEDRYSPEEIETLYSEGFTDEYAKILRSKRIKEGLSKLEGFIGVPLDNFMTVYQQAAAGSFIYNSGIGSEWKFTENLRKAARAKGSDKRDLFMEEAIKEMDIVTVKGKKEEGLVKRRLLEQKFSRPKSGLKKLARPE
jgi:GH24 family phage-related lysozyme (muramidase)